MALKISGNFKFKGIRWRSGLLYTFRYSNWFEDPEPMTIVLYKITGIHPSTGHQWNLLQCINMNYVPRHIRKNFIINWKQTLERNNGNVLLTWDEIKAKFPGIAKSNAIRRYQLKPQYMISKPKAIPIDQMEETIVSSWHKDFSKKMKMSLTRKYRQAQKKRKKRTDDKGISKILSTIFGRGK